jgi:hypothetical protein
MKKIKYNLFVIVTLMAIITNTSCKKVLDVNVDPNNPLDATSNLILPAAQVELGLTVGNTWNYVGCMWAQYWTGGYGVSTANLEYYNMNTADVETAWTRAYARTLADIDAMNKKDEVIYAGIGKIMSAYIYQMIVDLHGDAPFSEALKGPEGILTPKFDKPEDVYAALIPLIDEGLDQINQEGAINPKTGVEYLVPTSNDLIYAGNLAKWKIFANTLKLKVLVRQGNKFAEAKALMDAPGSVFISSSSDECKLQYFGSSSNTNPLYARFVSRTATGMYYVAANSSVQTLVNLGDPRKNKIYTSGTGLGGNEGVNSGDINDNTTLYPSGGLNTRFCRPSTSTFGANVPVFIISSWESKFLQAEVLTRIGGFDAQATALFEEAVTLSCAYYSLSGSTVSDYISLLAFSGKTSDEQLDILGVQKWISMNGLQMAEGWLETLRFDRAGHHIFTDAATGIYTSPINTTLGANKYPTSFIYPTQETSLNPNTPANRRVSDRRFWDAD